MKCVKCNSETQRIHDVNACMACGFTFTDDGKSIIQDTNGIADIFKVATDGNKMLQEIFEVERMPPPKEQL